MHKTVGRVLRISGNNSVPSKVRATSTREPAASPAKDKSDAPICEAELPGKKMSVGVSSSPLMALATIQPNDLRVCVTPFGLPVLPDVKKINTGASGPVAGKSDPLESASNKSSSLGAALSQTVLSPCLAPYQT